MLTILIVFFSSQPDEPNRPIFEWSTRNNLISVITNGVERLAVMENFGQLDRRIADECFAPVKLNPRQFQTQRAFQLASQFLKDIQQYKTAEEISKFINTTRQVLEGKGQAPQSVLDQFNALKGSKPIIESSGNPEVLQVTFEIANGRLQQLNARSQIKMIQKMVDEGLLKELERSGIEVTRPHNGINEINDILRYWELTGTRYILCHSGNDGISKFIRDQFPNKYRPVYMNAINVIADPVQRRFEAETMLEIVTDSNKTGIRFRESENGTLALMKYKGALPRAKLYTDWISEPKLAAAHDIAFSTGFIPQAQVILQTDSVPKPQQPARTVKLEPVKIIGMSRNYIEIEIPPMKHNAVLLINNKYDKNWKATISDQKVDLIKANLNACALYLNPLNKSRSISLQRP